ncbi:Pyridoxal-phosphate dependent enzyme [Asanoa hainanensis]|uniref:Pyridoxal-phosphate dependent enzyme n=2 Tax=Asanoa hainanensis TaxID=560556 RepID=A0A239PCF5_9ACTN|nr:Pyridoxal-phosphate dependent enzyme [Asanoa hainanensis]
MGEKGGLGAIGGTPLVALDLGGRAGEVWVKVEAANPTGSYKDRMALAMIEAAERDGRLQQGQTVVEYTGGSTGSSLAFVCAVKGYPLKIVSSDAFADEKIRTMRAFGADVELIHSPGGSTSVRPAPSWARPGRSGNACRTPAGSLSSPPSPRSCPGKRRGPTTSRAAASATGRRS